jgi:hypothetical protein
MSKIGTVLRRVLPRSLSQKALLLGIALAFVLSALLLADEKLLHKRIQAGIGMEPFKLVLQFLLITVAGGAVLALIDSEARRRELRRQEIERRSNLYNDFIRRTGTAYRDAKSCRRKLRAAGLSPAPEIFSENQWQTYCAEMQKLNDVQLALEQLKIEAGTHPDLRRVEAGTHPDLVSSLIEKMEKYLGDLISEFEKVAGNNAKAKTETEGAQTAVRFDQPKRLDEFTEGANSKGHETQRTFDTDFANAHKCVTKLLRDVLLSNDDTERR